MTEIDIAAVQAAVDAALARARLTVTPEEYEQILRNYPIVLSQLQALRIPDVRYGEPSIIFPAITAR